MSEEEKQYDSDPHESLHPSNEFDTQEEFDDYLKQFEEEKQKSIDKSVSGT